MLLASTCAFLAAAVPVHNTTLPVVTTAFDAAAGGNAAAAQAAAAQQVSVCHMQLCSAATPRQTPTSSP